VRTNTDIIRAIRGMPTARIHAIESKYTRSSALFLRVLVGKCEVRLRLKMEGSGSANTFYL
jgi:hypothetical protein